MKAFWGAASWIRATRLAVASSVTTAARSPSPVTTYLPDGLKPCTTTAGEGAGAKPEASGQCAEQDDRGEREDATESGGLSTARKPRETDRHGPHEVGRVEAKCDQYSKDDGGGRCENLARKVADGTTRTEGEPSCSPDFNQSHALSVQGFSNVTGVGHA